MASSTISHQHLTYLVFGRPSLSSTELRQSRTSWLAIYRSARTLNVPFERSPKERQQIIAVLYRQAQQTGLPTKQSKPSTPLRASAHINAQCWRGSGGRMTAGT